MKSKFFRLGLPLLLSLALLFTGCNNNKANVVATVNGDEITRQQLDNRLNAAAKQFGIDLNSEANKEMKGQIEQGILDELIVQTLILQEAEKQKLTPAKEEVDKEFNEIKASVGKEEDFKKALEEAKMTEQDVKDNIVLKHAYTNLYEKQTADVKKPTDEEIAGYYNNHKQIFGTPEQLEVKHMLFAVDSKEANIPKRTDKEALEAAKLALAEVTQKGRDFASVARQLSDDLGTRENGGSYTIDKGANTTDPAFEKAAVALKPGEITKEPVKSAYGYHLIKLENILPATQKSLDEVKDNIAAQLESEAKQAKFSQYVEDLRKNAKVDNKIAPETGDSSKK
ncbi:MAG: peptidylprolyl isomerase [Bacillota bacterium]|nr:peptidylprolyl isomerase [Bacillota bacterium]